jgi:hypothetical protein
VAGPWIKPLGPQNQSLNSNNQESTIMSLVFVTFVAQQSSEFTEYALEIIIVSVSGLVSLIMIIMSHPFLCAFNIKRP